MKEITGNLKNTGAVILAAGQGTRMGSSVPKQFMEINGRPMIYYSLKTFADAGVGPIVLVTGENMIERCRDIIDRYLLRVDAITAGGAQRYDSVYAGLRILEQFENVKIVAVHDGARPLVAVDIIRRVCSAAGESRAAIPGVPVKDTIKVVDTGASGRLEVTDTPDRSRLYQVQTPQCFDLKLLIASYDAAFQAGDQTVTDDSMVVEKYSDTVCTVVEGSYRNIKVTTPEDMLLAQAFLNR